MQMNHSIHTFVTASFTATVSSRNMACSLPLSTSSSLMLSSALSSTLRANSASGLSSSDPSLSLSSTPSRSSVTPLSYSGVALTLCCLLIISLPYLYDRTVCFRLSDLPRILPSFRSRLQYTRDRMLQSGSRCVAAISHFVLPCLPFFSVLITHASCGPFPS